MSILSWVKTAATVSTGGMASVYLYGGLLLTGGAVVGGAVWWHANKVDDHYEASFKAGRLELENSIAREQGRELTRLVEVNQEIQNAYQIVSAELVAANDQYDSAASVRGAQRTAIVDAAAAAPAGTCDRYAAVCERDIAGVEADADKMGRLAVRASASAEASKRTLQERRADIAARRKTLTPTTED